jgi:hypothetical protein
LEGLPHFRILLSSRSRVPVTARQLEHGLSAAEYEKRLTDLVLEPLTRKKKT